MTTSEPTTGEIVRALRCIADNAECKDCRYKYPVGNVILCDHEQMNENAADRLESQEATIATMRGDNFDATSVTKVLAYLDTVMGLIHCADGIKDLIVSMQGTAEEQTARAESAERERDAAKADMKFLDRCKTCFHAKTRHLLGSKCKSCKALSNFKWRGLPQEGERK